MKFASFAPAPTLVQAMGEKEVEFSAQGRAMKLWKTRRGEGRGGGGRGEDYYLMPFFTAPSPSAALLQYEREMELGVERWEEEREKRLQDFYLLCGSVETSLHDFWLTR